MKLSLTPLSDHSKPITSRDELDNYIVESFAGSSQVKFSALVEHRMYADKMIGWWDPVSKAGAIYGDHLAEANAAIEPVEEKKAGGVVKPLTTAGDEPANTVTTPLSEGHAYAFLDESTIATTFFEGSLDDFKARVKKAHPAAIFTDPGKMGVEARVGKEVVGSVGELSGKKVGVWRGGYRAELRGDKSLKEGKGEVLTEGAGNKASVSSIDWSIGKGD